MTTNNHIDIQVRWIVFITHVAVHSFIAFPIVLYSFLQFNQLTKNHEMLIIQKRYPSIVKLQCYICFFILIIERNIVVFLNASFVELIDPNMISILSRIQRIIYPSMSILFWCILWRFWHIYYELQLAKALSESRWVRYLNSDVLRNNWFVNNKYKYGVTKYTSKVMFVLLLLITIIRITAFQIFMFNDKQAVRIEYFIDLLLYLNPVTIMVVLACKSPSIQDTFYIKQEVKYCAITLYSSLFGCAVFIALNQANIMDPYWIKVVFSYLGTWAVFSLCIIQTLWVQYKIQNDPSYVNSVPATQSSHINSNKNTYALIVMTNMKQYIAQQEGFEYFIAHLCREFSLELMLFFIEVFQFKALIKCKYDAPLDTNVTNKINVTIQDHKTQEIEIENEVENEDYNLNHYESTFINLCIPKSQIVHQLFEKEKPNIDPTASFQCLLKNIHSDFTSNNSNTNTDIITFKTVSFLLYLRYVKRGSQQELNLSHGCRESLDEQLHDLKNLIENKNVDLPKLYHIFDQAVHEICTLLLYSFDRYKVDHLFHSFE